MMRMCVKNKTGVSSKPGPLVVSTAQTTLPRILSDERESENEQLSLAKLFWSFKIDELTIKIKNVSAHLS